MPKTEMEWEAEISKLEFENIRLRTEISGLRISEDALRDQLVIYKKGVAGALEIGKQKPASADESADMEIPF